MIQGEPNVPILLSLQLDDGRRGKYPRVKIMDTDGVQVGSPIELNESIAFDGLYQGLWTTQSAGDFTAGYEVFDDEDHLVLSDYILAAENIRVRLNAVDLTSNAVSAIWDEVLSGHLSDGSAGRSLFASGGMAGLHVRDDAINYDSNDRPTKVRRRWFATSEAAQASTPGGTGEGEVLTVEGDATHISASRWQSLLRRTP